jgi:hypothetical protein
VLCHQGLRSTQATAFTIVLRVGVKVSSCLWSGVLQRVRGRGALALTALLALATL